MTEPIILEESQPDEYAMSQKSLGQLLQYHREQQGLSLSDVSQVIKFPPKSIRRLEQEEWDALPRGFILRNMISQYATLLQLDKEAVLEKLTVQKEYTPVKQSIYTNKKAQTIDEQGEEQSSWIGVVIWLVVILLLIAGFVWLVTIATGLSVSELIAKVGSFF